MYSKNKKTQKSEISNRKQNCFYKTLNFLSLKFKEHTYKLCSKNFRCWDLHIQNRLFKTI